MKRQYPGAQRLAVITGTHPQAFPNLGDRIKPGSGTDNNPYALADLRRDVVFGLLGLPVSVRPDASHAQIRAQMVPDLDRRR